MREAWRRGQPEFELDASAIAALVAPAVPGASVLEFRPATGGLANTNVEVTLSTPPGRVLLRLYQRDPRQAGKEAAIHALAARQGIPVARFLHFAETNALTHLPYGVLTWVDGERLETVVGGLDDAAMAILGRSVGATLATIHAVAFDKPGFFGADLCVPAATDNGKQGLLAYLRRCLLEGAGGERLGAALTAALLRFVERHGDRLEAWLAPPCLVHADFNGSNILVQRDGDSWRVAAVLDWEFAFAGSPAFDFGNLLRPPLGSREVFRSAVAGGYAAAGGVLPQGWLDIARIADLYAWADFLSRPAAGGAIIEDARRAVGALIGRSTSDC